MIAGSVAKIFAGGLVVVMLGGGVAWYQLDPSSFKGVLGSGAKSLAWLGLVAVLPWATFFVSTKAAKADTNAAGVGVVVGYTIVALTFLLWLFGWRVNGATAWTLLAFATLLAAAYNVLVCDLIAEKWAS